MSRRDYHKHDPAPLSLYNRSTAVSHYISDHKSRGQKNQERQSDGLPCLDKAVLAQGGWGGEGKTHIMMATTPIAKRIIKGA